MLAIDSNQVKIVELEAEIGHLHTQQERITAELRVKFTPKNIVHTLNKCRLLLDKLEKTTCLLLSWRKKLERKKKQLKRSYRKNYKKSKSYSTK